jgi:hypothetical protein
MARSATFRRVLARRLLRAALVCVAAFAVMPRANAAETLKITSDPPGANVELNGSVVGQTPFTVDFPSVYFHKPHTSFGERLEHPIVVKLTKTGFVGRQMILSDGPLKWIGLTGRQHGTYFVLRADHFEFKLDSASAPGDTALGDEEKPGPLRSPHHAVAPAEEFAADTGSVLVASDPAGAEIYVDGNFVGQTPSTLHVAGGSHRIELKADGRKPWVRQLQITKGSQVSVHPALPVAAATDP